MVDPFQLATDGLYPVNRTVFSMGVMGYSVGITIEPVQPPTYVSGGGGYAVGPSIRLPAINTNTRTKGTVTVSVKISGREFKNIYVVGPRSHKIAVRVLKIANVTVNQINITVDKMKRVAKRAISVVFTDK